MTETFDGRASAGYILQTSTNLVSGSWSTVSPVFTADTNIVVAATNDIGFYRVIGN